MKNQSYLVVPTHLEDDGIHPRLRSATLPRATHTMVNRIPVPRDSARFVGMSSINLRRPFPPPLGALYSRPNSDTAGHHPHRRPRLFHDNTTVVSRRRNTTTATSMIRNTAENSTRWVWDLKVNDLLPVPLYHPLERNSIVLTTVPVETISAQISDFMRLNSIRCYYYNHFGRVDCCTPNLLKFVVQLWKKTTNDGEVRVVMEIQRRQGCSIEMQHIRSCLVRSIFQKRCVSISTAAGTCGGKRSPRVLVNDTKADLSHSLAESNLKICATLLESRMSDQNRLGLESLATLTQCSTVRKQDAEYVAKEVIYGKGKYGERLQNALARFFQDTERPKEATVFPAETGGIYDSDDEDEYSEYAQGRHFGTNHFLALQVLTNALDVMLGPSADEGADAAPLLSVDLETSFWKHVRSALEYNLSVGGHRAQEAALSAKCIRQLSELAPIELGHMLPMLAEAHHYGMSHHLSLEVECRDLMGRLASVY